jgi:hypothetical protein
MWVVEIDRGGINWVIICLCVSKEQAEHRAIEHTDDPVRVRKYGEPVHLTEDRTCNIS